MDTRTRILEAARRAFREKGYAATRLEDLAGELGLTKGALYHHFPSKRALLEALLEASQARAWEALQGEGPLEGRLLRYALAYREGVEPLGALATAQGGRGGEEEAWRVAQEAMRREMARLEAFFEDRHPGRGRSLAALFSSLVHGAYMLERHLGGQEAEGLLEEWVGVFVRGLPKEEG
ncbi:MAG: TetR/AcrR family transcriptional regulator [Thermus sp.]|uniref:TetR/AcrR family transcriptional regulator n=1 Tax=Thermus sp. TaxID=275 RepID=UPI0025E093AE|nr:TetR/AcrR family transcriptional regulator [Thermus sp.]MCS6867238.1 TetR/AcrR family transcriptional regulator [Thermus sp.]MCS7219538.1 TetR/AcrR family transcriptional regulator [Thermus sp.]MCX7850970.1 TetR/AcrR family transcriptional regulator [Thermus sp.]MDW8018422.1 helix-turn-helix domain-containing protein [Thermus sp.]MDW8358879.1 helix-turn-helix domain-containing protein [Thermus sp.]